MTDDSSFLRAVCEYPDDDGPRLVWADRLDEEGNPRGEFIRVQCKLARWPCECDTSEERVYHEECRCKERAELRRREWELAKRHCAAWACGVMRALGADRVRLTTTHTDLEFSLDGRPIAAGKFRRGFVETVALTARQFFGGPCEWCGGLGYEHRGPTDDSPFRGPEEDCPACRDPETGEGTGHVKGVAAALFRETPVTKIHLSDREPRSFSDGRCAWWYTNPNWHALGLNRHWLPAELSPYLTGSKVESLPGVCVFSYGNLLDETDGVALANADLSIAVVKYGRSLVLPLLPGPARAVTDVPEVVSNG